MFCRRLCIFLSTSSSSSCSVSFRLQEVVVFLAASETPVLVNGKRRGGNGYITAQQLILLLSGPQQLYAACTHTYAYDPNVRTPCAVATVGCLPALRHIGCGVFCYLYVHFGWVHECIVHKTNTKTHSIHTLFEKSARVQSVCLRLGNNFGV